MPKSCRAYSRSLIRLSAMAALAMPLAGQAQQYVWVDAGADHSASFITQPSYNYQFHDFAAQNSNFPSGTGPASLSGASASQSYSVSSNASSMAPTAATQASANHQVLSGAVGSATASGDIGAGTVAISNVSSGGTNCFFAACGSSRTTAAIQDNLHFTVAGASATTITPIQASFSWSATASGNSGNALWQYWANLGTASVSLLNDYADGYSFDFNSTPPAITDLSHGSPPLASGWASYQFVSKGPNLVTFIGTYDLVGSTADAYLGLSLFGSASNGAQLAGNGIVSLALPANVSYTSDSGVALGIAAVPEPQSWAMVFAGLGVVVLALRRREAA